MVRDRLNHASYVAWQTIHHTDSAVELLSRPWIKIVDLAVPTEHPLCLFTGKNEMDQHAAQIRRISRGSRVQPQSLSVIATLARRVRYRRIRT
jgi:hypothetical protein